MYINLKLVYYFIRNTYLAYSYRTRTETLFIEQTNSGVVVAVKVDKKLKVQDFTIGYVLNCR